jgi:hypothetical protein
MSVVKPTSIAMCVVVMWGTLTFHLPLSLAPGLSLSLSLSLFSVPQETIKRKSLCSTIQKAHYSQSAKSISPHTHNTLFTS